MHAHLTVITSTCISVADLGEGAKGPWPPPLQGIPPTSEPILDYLFRALKPAKVPLLSWGDVSMTTGQAAPRPRQSCSHRCYTQWRKQDSLDPPSAAVRLEETVTGTELEVRSTRGALLGARGLKVGSIQGVIIGGQGSKSGVYSRGNYWGPGAEKWGPSKRSIQGKILGAMGQKEGTNTIGSLLGARVRKVGSLHGVIIIVQLPKKWGPFMVSLLGAKVRKVGSENVLL